MKNKALYILASACFLALATGCVNEEKTEPVQVGFTAEAESFNFLNEAKSPFTTWSKGDKVGIAVHATKELPFRIEEASSPTALAAESADFTTEYGDVAYACIPASGALNFMNMTINVPASQTVTDGYNPALVNSIACAEIVDGKTNFSFKQKGAVISIGLASSENITLKNIKLTAQSPASGSYLAGTKSVEFQTETSFTVSEKVKNGSNTVEVEFPQVLKLTPSVQYVNVAVLPFSTTGSGFKLVLTDSEDHTCTMQVLDGDSIIGNGGAVSMEEGDYFTFDAGNIKVEDFDIPAKIRLHLVDKTTMAPMTDHDVYIYSVTDNAETLVETVKTDSEGVVSKELAPGTYKFAAACNDSFGPQWNATTMTLAMNDDKDFTLEVLPIIFADDFSWITTDMGGSSKTLKPYYESYDPPAYHAAASDEAMIKESTAEAQAKLAEIGWEWTTADFAYLRPGMIKFGKKNGTGSITTPALSKYYDNVPSSVLLKVSAVSWNNSPDKVTWVYEKSQLTFTIIGGGSFSESDTQTTYTSGLLNSGTPPDFYTIFELPIYGATASTQIKIGSVKQSSGTQWRCMIDDVRITPLIQ